MSERRGHCLCGSVRLIAHETSNEVGACHCKMCRRWGGGPFMEIECGTNVTFDGEENISVYDSSDWGQRGFCNQCGAHLFFLFKKTGGYGVPIGLFDDDEKLEFRHQVFIDDKPPFYEFANKTNNMTGPELIAKYTEL